MDDLQDLEPLEEDNITYPERQAVNYTAIAWSVPFRPCSQRLADRIRAQEEGDLDRDTLKQKT